MGYWNTRGLRGSTFEEMINTTNTAYREKGLALIQKVPTPITPISIDKNNRSISHAYFEKKSTVDYLGVVQGIPVCFEAKETSKNYLPLQNIHEHQMNFMKDFVRQKGIAFLLVSFTAKNEMFFLPFDILKTYWDAARADGRKSIPHDCFDKDFIVVSRQGFLVHYLEAIDTYLRKREE